MCWVQHLNKKNVGMSTDCVKRVHTVHKFDGRANNDRVCTLGLDQDVNRDSVEVELPPPTSFRRQNKKAGFLTWMSEGTISEHTRTDITPSIPVSQRKLVCTEMVQSTNKGTRVALNYEEWRKVFEQFCT